jgi:uncharacterized phosphosugar-binding protein
MIDTILEIVQKMEETQIEAIEKASELLASRLQQGGIIHVFGAGHSRAFGMEMCGRAGGLVPLKLVALEDIALVEGTVGINLTELERSPETAHRLMELHEVQDEDGFIIVSNSGRNGSAVELATICRERGIPVVAVTSLNHSQHTDSRHPSGKKLYELADIVIDNCCPYGDVLLQMPNTQERTGSASSVVGALIAQALTTEIIRLTFESGETPPVYISANLDGGDEHNRKIIERYAHRNITY